MNSEDFIFLLKHPKKIDAQKTQQLDEIIKNSSKSLKEFLNIDQTDYEN